MSKPVIVTNWSAPTEFCNCDNSILISCKMEPAESSAEHVSRGIVEWAAPSIDDCAKALRNLYEAPLSAKVLGHRALESINEYFSVKNFKSSVERFLL